ncbi:hypothetical protein M514_06913 [Trichuris suis]|uniref:Uncharacterized protein n=1 Tax=Trichuris suis TaxID=68888 RepID=A0A085NLL2_9BILA|nr:hypothetical protein M513_06913 [Trichuris suis]KFD70358.1 hypothetical protein M514_06913 [Trichuris suis]
MPYFACSEIGWVGLWVLCVGTISLSAIALFELNRVLQLARQAKKQNSLGFVRETRISLIDGIVQDTCKETALPLPVEKNEAGKYVVKTFGKKVKRDLFCYKFPRKPFGGEQIC